MSTLPSSAMTPEPDMQEFALRTRKSPGHAWLALAIVAAVFLVLTSAWRQGWFTPTSHVYIEVAGASGIQAGTQVRLKGFKIGEVDDIKLEKNLSVRVRLRIETEKMELLGANASAKFGRDSPIAGKFIELLPGAREGQRLAGGQTLPVDAGNELDDVMATVKVAVDKLSIALGKIDPILDDTRKLTNEAASMRPDTEQFDDCNAGQHSGHVGAVQADQRKRACAGRQYRQRPCQSRRRGAGFAEDPEQRFAAGAGQNQRHARKRKVRQCRCQADLRESRNDIPAIVRSGRTAAQDAAEITTGLKGSWPFSGAASPAEPATLPLDSFEGRK